MSKVLCVEKSKMFTGFIGKQLFNINSIKYVERNDAEKDITLRQIIPYVVVRNNEYKFLVYDRKGDEKRLHGFSSIGIGGHIGANDLTLSNSGDKNLVYESTITQAATREVYEEIGIKPKFLAIRGILIDDSSEVQSVHVGILMEIFVENKNIKFGEELLNPRFVTQEELLSMESNLEMWSKIALQELIRSNKYSNQQLGRILLIDDLSGKDIVRLL